MKTRKYIMLGCCFLLLGSTASCEYGLDIISPDVISEPVYFKTADEFKQYANQFYEGMSTFNSDDDMSDICKPSGFNNVSNSTYIAGTTDGTWDGAYAALRSINYGLEKCADAPADLKESIKHLEPVQDVYIRRFWFPARLQIIIIERTPILTISPEVNVAPIAFFSVDGTLIGREYMPLDATYKTWLVLTYGTKDDYRSWDESKVRIFRTIAQSVEDLSGEPVEYIDYKDPDDIYIKIPTVNIRLGKISTTTMNRIARLPSLLPQVKMLNKKVKYIDLRWEETNYIKLDE